MHPGGSEIFGCAPGEDVDVLPIQRAVTLIGFGLPDPRAFLSGVLRPQREDRSQLW